MEQIITDIMSGFFQETVLAILLVVYLLCSLTFGKYIYKAMKWVAVGIIVITICSVLKVQVIPNYYSFNGSFVSDFYVVFMKLMVLINTFFVILLSKNVIIKKRHKSFNFFSLILLSALSGLCVVCANDFVVMLISLIVMNITSGVLIAISAPKENKAFVKKIAVSNVISFLTIIIGVAFIYNVTNSLNFEVIYAIARQVDEMPVLYSVGCVLCSVGLCLNLMLVPFSNWTSDIFKKSSDNISLYLSVVPTFATLGIISRLIVYLFQYTPMTQALLFLIGMISIAKGFLCAIKEDNLRAFMSSLTISQMGFIILGFNLANTYATSTSIFYMVTFLLMNIGCWSALILFSNVTGKENISDLKGLVRKSKSFSLAWIICFIAFAGLPVSAGFISKIYLFEAIAKCSELYIAFLAIILLETVLGIYVCFRPIKEMFYIEDNSFYKNPRLKTPKIVLYICAILSVIICFAPDKLIQICQFVAYQL